LGWRRISEEEGGEKTTIQEEAKEIESHYAQRSTFVFLCVVLRLY
jgi:hypothetical protein